MKKDKKSILKEKLTLTSRWSLKKPLYLGKKDKRYKKHLKQLKENGFSDAETWGLDSVITEFVLPRLKRFREIHNCYPVNLEGNSEEKWIEILDKMIFSFEWSIAEMNLTAEYCKLNQEEIKSNWEKYAEGMKLFSEYFRDLWW